MRTVPTVDQSVWIAKQEVADLVYQLEPTLTPQQRSLLHQLRLAAESLGAVRATQALRRP